MYPETRVSLRQWLGGDYDNKTVNTRTDSGSKCKRQPWEIQSIVRQIFTGVSTLHSSGMSMVIFHLTLSSTWDPDDILETRSALSMSKQCTALIHGLENSINVRGRNSASVGYPQILDSVNTDYIAPELRAEKLSPDLNSGSKFAVPPNSLFAADMWSLM